jgi:cell division cycle 20-like protein 1 (cofactor of APC complex)
MICYVGLLASGGGTADRCIRFWNTLNGSRLQAIDTGSQVCNLMWSKNSNEVVSTHGYSLNQIIVWKYPTMTKLATLTGHTYRVLYLAMSPDGQTIVTGAGDETLRFWNAFPRQNIRSKSCRRIGSSPWGLASPSVIGNFIRWPLVKWIEMCVCVDEENE